MENFRKHRENKNQPLFHQESLLIKLLGYLFIDEGTHSSSEDPPTQECDSDSSKNMRKGRKEEGVLERQ